MPKLTGSLTNYYLVQVNHPQRDVPAYQAECEDIIEALELNPDEANIFKEIWRGANARKGNGKSGHTPLYGAEKIYHYAGRILRRAKRLFEPKEQEWIDHDGGPSPYRNPDQMVEIKTRAGTVLKDLNFRLHWNFQEPYFSGDIIAYRPVNEDN